MPITICLDADNAALRSPARTRTQLYDRERDEVSFDEVERS